MITKTELIEQDFSLDDHESEDDNYRERRHEIIQRMKRRDVQLSHTSFNEFCKSPRHFINYKLRTYEPTPAMKFGSMVHCSVLEPEQFDARYYVLPGPEHRPEKDKAMNSKLNREWKAEMIAAAGGKEVVEKSDFDAALRIGETVRKNEAAGEILEKITRKEHPVEWEYKRWNWRGVIDMDGDENGLLADLKVLSDVSPRKVDQYVRYEGAGRQAVHYTRAKGGDLDYFILAVDRHGNCSVSRIGKGLLNQISRDIDWYLAKLESCIFLNQWDQSYDFYLPNGINEITAL